jgi:Protein of unknown function (DUF3592)
MSGAGAPAAMPARPLRPARARTGGGKGWAVFFALLGLILGYGAWTTVSDILTLSRSGQQAEATVVGMEERRGRRGGVSYYPVFQYRTVEGKSVRNTSAGSVTPADYPRSRTVAVLFDPANPSHVRPAADVAAGFGVTPWILGSFSLLMFGCAALFFLPGRKQEPATRGG